MIPETIDNCVYGIAMHMDFVKYKTKNYLYYYYTVIAVVHDLAIIAKFFNQVSIKFCDCMVLTLFAQDTRTGGSQWLINYCVYFYHYT